MSERIAIVTDSNSGITQEAAKNLGVFVIPMPFVINEETFYAVSYTHLDVYKRQESI